MTDKNNFATIPINSRNDIEESGILGNRELALQYIESLNARLLDVIEEANKKQQKIDQLRRKVNKLREGRKELYIQLTATSAREDELRKFLREEKDRAEKNLKLLYLERQRTSHRILRSSSACAPTSDSRRSLSRSSSDRSQSRRTASLPRGSRQILFRPEGDTSSDVDSQAIFTSSGEGRTARGITTEPKRTC